MSRPRQSTALRAAFAAWLLGLLWVLPAFAQAGRVLIDDPDGLFGDGSAVRQAAERLADEGADVIVVGIREAGTGAAAAEASLDQRLRTLGVADDHRTLRGNQIVFFVSPESQYDAIFAVPRYRPQLEQALARIRREQMQPRYTTGDYAGGMVAGIDAVRTTLNPPTSPVVWIGAGGAVAAAAGAAGVSSLRKRRAVAETLGSAKGRMEEARRAAGVALADLGARVATAREKARFDKISYSAADTAGITERQTEGETRFAQAQSAFDAAEETHTTLTRPTVADYEALAANYADARRLAQESLQAIEQAEHMRLALDNAGAPATGETRAL